LPAEGPARRQAWRARFEWAADRARAWPALIAADGASHVTLKALEVVEGHARRVLGVKASPPTYRALVSELGMALESVWGLSEFLVIAAADELAELGDQAKAGAPWKAKGKAILDDMQAQLKAEGRDVQAGPLADTFTRYTAAAFLLGQTETTKPIGWDAGFSLTDQDAVIGLANSGLFWVNEHYGDALDSAKLLRKVEDVILSGEGRAAGGAILREAFGAEFMRSTVYWQGLAATVATRARTFGALSGMAATGATTYEYVNPVDERTSDVCRELDGVIFTVKGGVELRDRLTGADAPKDPDGWKAIAPWPKKRDLQGPDGTRLSAGELQAKGIAWPPLHFHCRSSIDVATWSEIQPEDLGALAAPAEAVEAAGPKPGAKPRAPKAPKAPPVPRHQVILGEKTGSAQGSNEGGFYTGTDGVRRYVKFYADAGQAATEHLSNRLYRDLGLPAARSELFRLPDGRLAYSSEILDNLGTLGSRLATVGAAERADLARRALDGFAADVLTANWDAAGLVVDNMIALGDGSIVRIDNGGALLYRAQGARKNAAALAEMNEWWMYLDGSNPGYSRLASEAGVKRAQEIASLEDQIERIEKLRPKKGGWAKYLENEAELSEADRADIAAMLEERTRRLAEKRADMVKRRRINEIEAELSSELTDKSAAARWGNANLVSARGKMSEAEKDAVVDYTSNAYVGINGNLRQKGKPTPEDLHRDRAMDRARVPRDLVLYRGVNYCPPLMDMIKDQARSEGRANTDLAYGSSSILREVGEQFSSSGREAILFRMLAPKGTPGIWVDDISKFGGEVEVLNPRDTTIRVLYSEWNASKNKWIVDVEIVPK
jgi:hypothetical protein